MERGPADGAGSAATLTTPIVIGGHEVASRVLFGPHETNLGRGRALSERHAAYYARRALGGAGLIVVETASVHDSDWPYERAPLAASCARGWRAIAEGCHRFGSLVLAGLGHTGGQGSSAWSQSALWAPSRVADPATRELPMEMEAPEIAALIEAFVRASRLAIESGVDGVEIDAGPRSLLRAFASGLTNERGDAYGADRTLLTTEVLSAVRGELGDGPVISIRLSCDELAPWAGITPEEAMRHAQSFAEWIDLIVVTRGGPFSVAAYRPDGHVEPGFNEGLGRAIREAVAGRAVVALQGSVVDPLHASAILATGGADLIEMTRAQIADPNLVAKVARGDLAQIRPCVLCNQTCQVRDVRNPIVTCIAEPSSGHETEDAPAEGGALGVHVVRVVGGGPAGLEAGRVAALRGAKVTVSDRGAAAGGMLSTIARAPGRGRFGLLAAWLISECDRLGVAIETGVEVGRDDLEAARSRGEAVIVATGGRFQAGQYSASAAAVILAPEDVLRRDPHDPSLPDGPVIVLDLVGGPVAVAAAEILVRAGRHVMFVTADTIVGTLLSASGDLVGANVRLEQAGVERMTSTLLREVGAGWALLEDRWDGTTRRVDAGFLVDCGPRLPDDGLANEANWTLRAGDCVAPRSVHEAILEGRRAAQVAVPVTPHMTPSPETPSAETSVR